MNYIPEKLRMLMKEPLSTDKEYILKRDLKCKLYAWFEKLLLQQILTGQITTDDLANGPEIVLPADTEIIIRFASADLVVGEIIAVPGSLFHLLGEHFSVKRVAGLPFQLK